MIIKCKRCGRKELMYAKGLCASCYFCLLRKKNPEYGRRANKKRRESGKAREDMRRWIEKHPDYYRNRMRKKNKIKPENYRVK